MGRGATKLHVKQEHLRRTVDDAVPVLCCALSCWHVGSTPKQHTSCLAMALNHAHSVAISGPGYFSHQFLLFAAQGQFTIAATAIHGQQVQARGDLIIWGAATVDEITLWKPIIGVEAANSRAAQWWKVA